MRRVLEIAAARSAAHSCTGSSPHFPVHAVVNTVALIATPIIRVVDTVSDQRTALEKLCRQQENAMPSDCSFKQLPQMTRKRKPALLVCAGELCSFSLARHAPCHRGLHQLNVRASGGPVVGSAVSTNVGDNSAAYTMPTDERWLSGDWRAGVTATSTWRSADSSAPHCTYSLC